MNTPWFDPNMFAWIPGTILGCLAGVFGCLAGWLAPQGRAKAFVLGFFWFLLGTSITLVIAGAVAFAGGQPYGVWYGLGLGGLIGVFVLGFNARPIYRVYRQAEERRMTAHDID